MTPKTKNCYTIAFVSASCSLMNEATTAGTDFLYWECFSTCDLFFFFFYYLNYNSVIHTQGRSG